MLPLTCYQSWNSEKAMAPHSSTLPWKIPWTEEPGGLLSMGSQSRTRLSDFTFTFHFHALEKEMATHSRVLAWRIPGTGEPHGLPSKGSHRVGHDWSDLAAAVAAVMKLQHVSIINSNNKLYIKLVTKINLSLCSGYTIKVLEDFFGYHTCCKSHCFVWRYMEAHDL